jgi:hypothetical protein
MVFCRRRHLDGGYSKQRRTENSQYCLSHRASPFFGAPPEAGSLRALAPCPKTTLERAGWLHCCQSRESEQSWLACSMIRPFWFAIDPFDRGRARLHRVASFRAGVRCSKDRGKYKLLFRHDLGSKLLDLH